MLKLGVDRGTWQETAENPDKGYIHSEFKIPSREIHFQCRASEIQYEYKAKVIHYELKPREILSESKASQLLA